METLNEDNFVKVLPRFPLESMETRAPTSSCHQGHPMNAGDGESPKVRLLLRTFSNSDTGIEILCVGVWLLVTR